MNKPRARVDTRGIDVNGEKGATSLSPTGDRLKHEVNEDTFEDHFLAQGCRPRRCHPPY